MNEKVSGPSYPCDLTRGGDSSLRRSPAGQDSLVGAIDDLAGADGVLDGCPSVSVGVSATLRSFIRVRSGSPHGPE